MTYSELCPSHCDQEGTWYDTFYCRDPHFCCIHNKSFSCCKNSTYRIDDDVSDDYNCYSQMAAWIVQYWRVIVGVCLPLGIICVMGALTLCGYMGVKQRRRRAHNSSSTSRTRCSSATSVTSRASCRSDCSSTESEVQCQFSLEDPTISAVDLSALPVPPPYISVKPPDYADIFPAETAIT